ncbi:hypothetical protein J2S13_003346 [Oikeobacillus pervagus]|uniref:Uncharacterized protein n=1 Tax=Oikeobacillus pervagus TaxID=1325931 RepID=A0AAJ1T1G4_9BACI|nr:hypothetical protein [Oikeobacillus pervagus]MDQ0216848.1 hypothetical protein [Oikeobacillus pervagus]
MKSLIEKFLSRDAVENLVINTTGKITMLMIGLMIGYYLKNWLF